MFESVVGHVGQDGVCPMAKFVYETLKLQLQKIFNVLTKRALKQHTVLRVNGNDTRPEHRVVQHAVHRNGDCVFAVLFGVERLAACLCGERV